MKIKIIPFCLETAKRIQAGEIEGKVYFKTKLADGSKTYTFNLKAIHGINNLECPYYGIFECDGEDCIQYIRSNGYIPEQLVYLIIEVPDNEPQFKPFDKVLVRNGMNCIWQPSIFSYQLGDCCYTVSSYPYEKENIIPYEGHENLVGTTDKPKDE